MDKTDWERLQFGVGVSIRYHAHRAAFFNYLNTINGVFSMFAGSAAAATAFNAHLTLATISGALVALSNSINVMAGSAQKVAIHRGLRSKFIAMEKELNKHEQPDADVYHRVLADRLAAEAEEPESLGGLYALAYNEQCRAMDVDSGLARRPLFQRLFKNIWDFEVKSEPPVSA